MRQRNTISALCIAAATCLALVVAMKFWPERPDEARAFAAAQPLEPVERTPLTEEETDSVQPDLGRAIGQDPGAPDKERLKILESFSGELSELEAGVLANELLRPLRTGEETAWYAEYFHSICLILCGEENYREQLARVLSTVVSDPSRDQTVRDYGMQHLGTLWETSPPGGGLRAAVLATFRQIIRDDKEMAAPTLLSLHLLGSGFNRSREIRSAATASYHVPDADILPLVEDALEIPAVTPSDVGLKMAALRVVADRRMTGLLPLARKIAEAGMSEHTVARMSAISAIGRLGDSSDRALLESLGDDDPRIAGAVAHALKILPES